MTTKHLLSILVIALGLFISGCATTPRYGPLTFNRAGADFYFAQSGKFAPTELGQDGVIEVQLSNASFQLGYNGRQLNLALAQAPISEISTDPKGFKASRLSGPMAGGRERNSDVLLVYSGKEWSDGNTEFSDSTTMRAAPLPGYQYAYQINKLDFLADKQLSLGSFKGVLYGFIVVYKQAERVDGDIMPIRLILN